MRRNINSTCFVSVSNAAPLNGRLLAETVIQHDQKADAFILESMVVISQHMSCFKTLLR